MCLLREPFEDQFQSIDELPIQSKMWVISFTEVTAKIRFGDHPCGEVVLTRSVFYLKYQLGNQFESVQHASQDEKQ